MRFGRYELGERLGQGGMAEVFKARLAAPGGVAKVVVVKRIRRELSDDPAFVEMFTDEARIAARLQHPNVVQVHDFGLVDGHWFMAMEWVDGLNLGRALPRLRADGGLPVALAAHIAREMCKGLHHAHTLADDEGRPLGVVHRDVCPYNVLLGFDGQVKVTDFGVAESRLNTFTTQGQSVRGHTAYLSPEQAALEPLDARTDVFAAGVVLYELLSGRRLFKADAPLVTLERVRRAEVPPLGNADVPPGLEQALRVALARDPSHRFATARAFQLALQPYLGDNPDALRERLARRLAADPEPTGLSSRGLLAGGGLALAELDEEDAPTEIMGAGAPPPPVEPSAAEPTVRLTPVEPPPGPPGPPPRKTEPPPTRPPEAEPQPPRRRAALAAAVVVAAALAALAWRSCAPTPPETTGPPAETEPVSAPAAAPEPAEPEAPEPVEPALARPAPTQPAPTQPVTEPASTATAPPVTTPPAGTSPAATPSAAPAPRAAAPPPEPVTAAPPQPTAAAPTAEPNPAEPPAADAPGTLSVRVTGGWGKVTLDGRRLKSSTPIEAIPLSPGEHIVRVELPSTSQVITRQVTIEPGQHLDLDLP